MKFVVQATMEDAWEEPKVAKIIIDTETNTLTVHQSWDREEYKLVPVERKSDSEAA